MYVCVDTYMYSRPVHVYVYVMHVFWHREGPALATGNIEKHIDYY